MTRNLAMSVVLAGLTVSGLMAAPARPLYVPPPPGVEHEFPNLADTVWKGHFFNPSGSIHVTFHRDGTLTYTDGSGNSPGVWRRTGDQVYIEINKYSEHRGPILGDVIQGESTNKGNLRGNFRLQRVGTISK
ncbi:MAG: hypothetical protein FJ303_25830 [Planctomycetes bacterium]|nr:hypothetical protein [Planctomycetota bacterium]